MPLKSKKIISILLAVFMMFSIMPIDALAEAGASTPPSFVDGYPQHNPQTAGSRRISMVINAQEAAYYYIVMLPDGADAPTKEQVAAGRGGDDQPALRSKDSGGVKYTSIQDSFFAPLHGTSYDVYVVLQSDAGDLSEPKKVDIVSPVAADLLAPGYPQTGSAQQDGSRQVEIKVKLQNTEEDKAGKVYWVLLPDASTAPGIEQIAAGKDGDDNTAISAASPEFNPGGEESFLVTGAAGGTAYDLYIVVGDTYYLNPLAHCTDIIKLDITTPANVPEEKVCAIGATEYGTLAEALSAAGSTATIKLLKSFTSVQGVEIYNKNITFDLNGQTLNITTTANEGLKVIEGTVAHTGSGALNVSGRLYGVWANKSTVTVTNATATDTDTSGAASGTGVYAMGGSNITVREDASGAAYGVWANNMSTRVTVNGDVSNSALAHGAVYSEGQAEVLVKGNVTSSQGYGAHVYGGKVTVDGNVNAGHVGAMTEGVEAVIYIKGDLHSNTFGAIVSTGGGNITVDGNMTANHYFVRIGSTDITKEQGTIDPVQSGYLKYSDSDSGIAGAVWLKGYAITAQSDGNGTATASAPSAAQGSEITLTATPSSGYRFKEWQVISGGVSITGDKFTMPANDVTVKAIFELIPATVSSVTVSPSTIEVQKGTERQFGATVTGTNNPAQTVTWNVSGKNSIDTNIDASGLLAVSADETATTLTVTATSTVDTGKSGTATVTVAEASAVPVTGITVTGGTSITTKDGTLQLAANVTPANATNKNVIWRIQSGSAYASINSSGLVTATANGTVMVRATAQDGSGAYGEKQVTISGQVGGGGTGGGSGGGTVSGTIDANQKPTTMPNQPTIASVNATAKVSGGHAAADLNDSMVKAAIEKALAADKAKGNTGNGIGVEVLVTAPGATGFTLTLERAALDRLAKASVKQLEISGTPVTLGLDLTSLNQIQAQGDGNIIITAKPITVGGLRNAFDITITSTKGGKVVNVTSLGNGLATLGIAATLGKGEFEGYLYGATVGADKKVSRIADSAYDAGSKRVIFSTNHFSVYGVGYNQPTANFTDISTHWAKDSIDYVVGRSLFSGTSDTTFAPNTAVSRGMLVTALGRLAGADVSPYKTSSFTDVAKDKYYLPYVEWAYKNGIIQGIGNSQFAPDRAVNREEMATIMQNYAKATGYKLPVTREATTFADNANISSWAKDAVTAMQQAGIMVGEQSGRFNPKAGITRAEASATLERYIKLTIDPKTAQGWAKNDDGQWMYYKDGKALTGWQTIGGARYFFEVGGVLKTGWVKDGDNWCYYSENKEITGWRDIDGKWYYFYANGTLARSAKIDDYEVDENGVRKVK